MSVRLAHVASFRLTPEEQSSASDHRKTTAPRGSVRVDDRMRAAKRQRDDGTATTAELAALYGVSRGTIQDWCDRVRFAEADARNMRGGR